MERCADPSLVDADLERLLPELYPDLRRLAAAAMRGERPGDALQPTALVHEVYLRLAGREIRWESRGHLLAVAARAMRRVLVDRARARAAAARGADLLAEVAAATGAAEPDLVGRQLGAYQLLARIGEGGMGVVYLAERADGQFSRRVAVKLIRPQAVSPDLLARFAAERHTLAALEHPGDP